METFLCVIFQAFYARTPMFICFFTNIVVGTEIIFLLTVFEILI